VIKKDSDTILIGRVDFSTLLQKHRNKKQETEECILKICGYIYHHGTYIPLWGVRHTSALFWCLIRGSFWKLAYGNSWIDD